MRQNTIAFWASLALVLAGSAQVARTAANVAGQAKTTPAIAAPAKPAVPAAIALHADPMGHFHAQAVVDGRSLNMVIDTGASLCVFSEEDAERMGIRVRPGDFTRSVSTANGIVRVAPVQIGLIQIGPIAVRNVEAVVIQRGLLGENLLGMSFLKRLRDVSMAGGRLTLRG